MPELDPALAAWRTERQAALAGKSDDDLLSLAKSTPPVERIGMLEKFRGVKAHLLATFGRDTPASRLSIPETRFVLALISADREEAVRRGNAKKTDAAPTTPTKAPATLEDLL